MSESNLGPRSAEGKAAVRGNAYRHGLTATKFLPKEEQANFQACLNILMKQFLPRTEYELKLVTEMANVTHRLDRIPQLENNIWEYGWYNEPEDKENHQIDPHLQTKCLQQIGLHQSRLLRDRKNLMAELEELRKQPKEAQPETQKQVLDKEFRDKAGDMLAMLRAPGGFQTLFGAPPPRQQAPPQETQQQESA